MELIEEWNKVMTQAPFNTDKNAIVFKGQNGGYVIMDAKLFSEAIIVIDWSEKNDKA